jgi:hypothetical protein
MLWKWVASFLLTAALILPILGLAARIVKEREMRMKDLLQISGLLDISYWASYLAAAAIICQFTLWVCTLLLLAGRVLTTDHVAPYAALLTTYSLALMTTLMAFGFVVFRSEYYSLPAFLLIVGLCVCGDYLADADNIAIGLKCKDLCVCDQPVIVLLSVSRRVVPSYDLNARSIRHGDVLVPP